MRKRKGFAYVNSDKRSVTDAATLARIASLAIPPAYADVWICADERGHLQATGRDVRQRKQYRYHHDWRLLRDSAKFQRMIEFGDALSRLRRRVRRDLSREGLPREKVLAAIVSLLDATWIRVGNAEYARDNDSYGLTTLRNRHVRFLPSGRLLFQFRAKGGAEHEVAVDDKRLVRIVRKCHQLPGQRLFQYLDDGSRHPIDSGQVNQYLKDAMGAEFTAKDFRTWGATLQAIAIMARTPLPESESEAALNVVHRRRGKAGRGAAAQYACGVSQVLYQSHRVRRLAQRSAAQTRSRGRLHGAEQERAIGACLPATKWQAQQRQRLLRSSGSGQWRGRGRPRSGPGALRRPARRCEGVTPREAVGPVGHCFPGRRQGTRLTL